MEGIEHKMVKVNGIIMHVAEKGPSQGPVVLFLHGFPDLWYTWRHQMTAFASAGYRSVAPDLRGYGDTTAPSSFASYSCHHLVGDVVALIDSLQQEKVFVVGHDWGAMIGWYVCLFRPDRVKAYVSLTVPFRPRNLIFRPVEGMRALFGPDYYMCRFQEPGVIEEEIERCGVKKVMKKIFTDRKPGPPMLPKDNPFGVGIDDDDADLKLPSWLSEEDLNYYATKYENKGFTGGLNYYRALDLNWELTAAWTGVQVKVPVQFIVGDLDVTYTTPGVKEYIHGGGFKKDVPSLEDLVVMEGVGHFIHQEKTEEINNRVLNFLDKF